MPGARHIPLTLLSQYLPIQYAAVRAGRLANDPRAFCSNGVAHVLRQYARACEAWHCADAGPGSLPKVTMNYFGLMLEEIETRGGPWTAREILQQPEIWRKSSTHPSVTARLAAFLASAAARPDVRVVLTGAGTSSFIGECLAPALAARPGHGSEPSRRRTW